MKKWLVAAVCAVAAVFGGDAKAEPEVRRLTVDLEWSHLPRTAYRGEIAKSRQRALVPNAEIRFTRWERDARTFVIEFDDGHSCSTTVEKSAVVSLDCGTSNAFYSLFQVPGRQSKLEWVTIGPQGKPALVQQ